MERFLTVYNFAAEALTASPWTAVPVIFGILLLLLLPAAVVVLVKLRAEWNSGYPAKPEWEKDLRRRRRLIGPRAGTGLLALAVFFVGAFIIWDFAVYYYAMIRWPAAQAVVTGSLVDCSTPRSGCRGYVDYSYNGHKGTAQVHLSAFLYDSRSDVEEALKRFPAGTQAVARYSPTTPAWSRLEGAGSMSIFAGGLLLLVSCGLSALLIYSAGRGKK
jgi:hypothetical protein